MAHGRRKANTDTLDAKIGQQKTVLEKAKARYETEKETLTELIKLRNEMRKEGLDEPGVIFSYTRYVRMLEANLPTLLDCFYSNIGYIG